MKSIIKIFQVILFLSISVTGFTQYSIGGGFSSFHGLNIPINRFGLNIFTEIPKSANTTLMIRASYMFPNKDIRTEQVSAKDPSIEGQIIDAELIAKTSYFAIDGGTRLYFINDYDIGVAIYAGGHLKGILSSYRASYRLPNGYDINDYQTPNYPPQPLNNHEPQYSLLLGFGGTAGVKYQLPTNGALTFDVCGEIITRLMDPYAILGNDISPISFTFNLAYRFDWY